MSAAYDLAAALVAAIRGELAALDAEDADAILAASEAKSRALADLSAALANGASAPRPLLEEARDLNSQAILMSRAKLISVEKRLAALRPGPALPRPEPVTYGRDGRWA
jgi:anti-sigma factor RsiW